MRRQERIIGMGQDVDEGIAQADHIERGHDSTLPAARTVPAVANPAPVMDASALEAFLSAAFPGRPTTMRVGRIDADLLTLHLPTGTADLRPGGTISGPTLMTLADTASYLRIVASVGPEALAVTTSLTMQFLKRPHPGDLVASATWLSLGRRLAVVDVQIHSEAPGKERLVAAAQVTYARALPDGTQGG